MGALPLLAWPDLRDAETRAEQATAAWRVAQQRWRCAPHGERTRRAEQLQAASAAALRAGIELERLRREQAR